MATKKESKEEQSMATEKDTAATRQPKLDAPSQEAIEAIAAIASHPEFTNLIREIEAQPESDRRHYAECVATVEEFAKRRIPTPKGLRVTTRYFEAPGASTTEMVKLSDRLGEPVAAGRLRASVCASVGFVVCVSVGT